MFGRHYQRRMATKLTGFEPAGLHSMKHLEEKACAKSHPTVESLKRALIKAWDEIKVETLSKIVDDFPNRLKACIEADGGHFE
uniref:Transposase n=1 Tax=Acrobeloides nanus TaxID=290746 RepID=A0A914DI04_9BILA